MRPTSRLPPLLQTPLARFALKGLVLYAVWFAVYEAWLGPDGRLDDAFSSAVAHGAAGLLHLAGYDARVEGDVVWGTATAGAWVTKGCNGLSTLALFVGFVVAFPGSGRRRALFLPLGAAFIAAVNVARVALIVGVIDRAPEQFEWVHALGAPHVFYATVFLLWVVWVRWGTPAPAPRDAPAPAPEAGVVVGQPA